MYEEAINLLAGLTQRYPAIDAIQVYQKDRIGITIRDPKRQRHQYKMLLFSSAQGLLEHLEKTYPTMGENGKYY